MNECFGLKFILNGNLLPSQQFDNTLIYDGDSVYEVLRMIKGSPVFFHDHIERLYNSVKHQRKEILASIGILKNAVLTLSGSDRREATNLKLVFNYNNGVQNWLVYFTEPMYPSSDQYRKGVKGILFRAERKDPESKVINHKFRSEIYQRLILDGAYEALLVNKDNMITEGSRSNIFFVRGNTLFTAPDNLILNGITRRHILEICSMENITTEMKCVSIDEIKNYDSVFMTGTSPTVLPFYCIDDALFDVRLTLLGRLRKLYLLKAEESMLSFRSE